MDSEIHLFSQFGHLSDTNPSSHKSQISRFFGGRKKRLPLQVGDEAASQKQRNQKTADVKFLDILDI
jgi:hypothetical protein